MVCIIGSITVIWHYDQPETQALYPESTENRDFIKSVYNNLFNRDPDEAGWDYWEEELNQGKYSKNLFIQTVINGAEAETGNPDDAQVLANKNEVGLYFADAGLSDVDKAKSVMSDISSSYDSVSDAKTVIDGYSNSAEVIVSEVSGNTASYNAQASFQVYLGSQPTADVTIPISSSDESEGIIDIESLTFTSENWNTPQSVIITGRNNNVVNGEQDYQIILGLITSFDANYDGLNPDDVQVNGISLELELSDTMIDLVSGMKNEIELLTNYNGNSVVSYSLSTSPTGMSIDSVSGKISWTPSQTTEGESFDVVVTATDGTYSGELSFTVNVAEVTTVQTVKTTGEIAIEDPTSSLNGIKIISSSSLSEQDVRVIPQSAAPIIPSHLTPISDIFIFSQEVLNEVIIDIPISNLNNNENIGLYTYYDEDEPNSWFKQFALMELINNDTIRLTLTATGTSPYFIGVDTTLSSSRSKASRALVTYTSGTITCNSFELYGFNLLPFICTDSSDSDILINVYGYESGLWGSATVTPATIAKWAVDGQTLYDKYGLKYDKEFDIQLEDMGVKVNGTPSKPTQYSACPGSYSYTAGFVSRTENYSILHLNKSVCLRNVNSMNSTTIHEYFHHSQDRSAKSSEKSVIKNINNRHWITEGTARWAQGEHNATYVTNQVIPQFLKIGINAPHHVIWSGNNAVYNAYYKYPFWEMMANECSFINTSELVEVFSMPNTQNSEMQNFLDSFDEFNCNFGIDIGSSNQDDLTEALLRYQYETLYKSSTTWGYGSSFDKTIQIGTKNFWQEDDDGVKTIDASVMFGTIPPYSAQSFKMSSDLFDDVDWNDENALPTLDIRTNSSNQSLIISMMSKASAFGGTSTGLTGIKQKTIKPTSTEDKYTFEENDAVELFFTVVNPTSSNKTITKFLFEIKEVDIEALEQTVQTPVNTPIDIVLEGLEGNDAPLTYQIEDNPTNGTLSGTPPNVTYTPNTDFEGTDTFTFLVKNDQDIESEPATVTVEVKPNEWDTGDWSECTGDCGSAEQTRTVECKNILGDTLDDSLCTSTKPIDTQSCTPDGCNPGMCLNEADQGNEKPMLYTIQSTATSGTFTFDYESYSIPDQFILTYPGGTFDTGAVGTNGWETYSTSYSGGSTFYLRVRPGPVGTAWKFKIYDACITDSQELGDEWYLDDGSGGGIIVVQ